MGFTVFSLYKFILKKSSTWFRLVSDALENLLRGYIFYNSFLADIGKFDIIVHLNIVCLTDTDKSDIWISFVVVLTGAGKSGLRFTLLVCSDECGLFLASVSGAGLCCDDQLLFFVDHTNASADSDTKQKSLTYEKRGDI